jgi:hypothetical protein
MLLNIFQKPNLAKESSELIGIQDIKRAEKKVEELEASKEEKILESRMI